MLFLAFLSYFFTSSSMMNGDEDTQNSSGRKGNISAVLLVVNLLVLWSNEDSNWAYGPNLILMVSSNINSRVLKKKLDKEIMHGCYVLFFFGEIVMCF